MNSTCATCPFSENDRICVRGEGGRHPDSCPTVRQQAVLSQAKEAYQEPVVKAFAAQASRQEASCYLHRPDAPEIVIPQKTRVQEIAEFCRDMGYQRIGLAFCSGVKAEAAALVKILQAYDLEVISAICKVGATEKEFLGLSEEDKIMPGQWETMCNPIGQAMILNEAKTSFNLVMGLCVGHDSLFFKYSKALCTVVAVKDRVLGHNPMAALYSSYYEHLAQKIR